MVRDRQNIVSRGGPILTADTPGDGAAPVDAPDVFISYAREDQAFVRRLHDSLEGKGHGSWVDWEGIPPSAEWLEEIYTAIDRSDTFIFVLSPDSLASKICRREVEHAVESNKRLVPVLCREIDAEAVPRSLARLNWIVFEPPAEFDASLAKLVEALETDLEWVHAHTRLLVKAREWERRGRDKSLALRGRDLAEAEEWLAQGATKDPRPSALQTQLVTSSRRVATRRQRVILAAVAVALAVSTGLGLLAESLRRIAETRRRVAVSQLLSAQSRGHLDGQLDLSLLLALEAHRVHDSFESRSAVLSALQHNPHLTRFLRGHDAGVSSLAFGPDGTTLVSAGWDERIVVWDLTAQRPRARLLGRHTDDVKSIAIGAGGRTLVSGGCGQHGRLCEQGEIRFWDLESFEALGPPVGGHGSWVNSVALTPDGLTLATASSDDTIRLWDLASGETTPPTASRELTGHESWVVRVAFSPDGRRLASASWDDTVRLWDTSTGRQIGAPLEGHTSSVHALAFDPGGRLLASGGSDGVRLWDAVTGELVAEPLVLDHGSVNSLALGPAGGRLAAATKSGVVLLWDLAEPGRRPAVFAGHPNEVFDVAFSPDGSTLASGDRDGLVLLWNLADPQPLAETLESGVEPISGVVFRHEGRAVAYLRGVSGDGFAERVAVFDLDERRSLAAGLEADFLASEFSPDGATLAVSSRSTNAGGETEIDLIDVASGESKGPPLVSRGGFVRHLAFSPDGLGLASAGEGGAMLWDLAGGEPRRFGEHGGALAFAPDGKILAVAGKKGSVVLWDAIAARPLGALEVGSSPIHRNAFAPDGLQVVTSSWGKTSEENAIQFWDVSTRQPLGAPIPDRWRARRMAFGPRGRLLALVSGDGAVVLIDVASRRQLGPSLYGHPGGANALAFDSTGLRMASGGGNLDSGILFGPSGERIRRSDGTLLLWDLDFDSWRRRACRIANRDLTREEWERYLVDEPRRETCSVAPTGGPD